MVTSPTKDEQLDFSKTVEVQWTSVSSDPSTFNLVLVDQTDMTPITVANDVKTSDGSFSLSNFVVTPGSQYKFNIMSDDPQNTGILAQSQTFSITKSGSTSSSSDSVSSATASGSTSTTESGSTITSVTASPTGTAAAASTSDDSSASTTLSTKTKTTAGTSSKTGSATSSGTANASSTGAAAAKSSNAAVPLNGKTFGIAGSVFAGLLMLF